MRAKIIAIALVAIASVSSQLVAQEGTLEGLQEVDVASATYDIQKNVRCRVIPTENGYSVTFDYDGKTPTNDLIVHYFSKRGYDYYRASSDFNVSSIDNAITEIKSPADAASGMASGKRQHKPLTVTQNIDKATPILYKGVSSTETTAEGSTALEAGRGGVGKVSMQDFHFTKRCAGTTTVYSLVDGVCVIPTGDCPDGSCDLNITWIWNEDTWSNPTRKSQNSVDFKLAIEDGACTAVAINEKAVAPKQNPKKIKSKN